MKNSQAHTSLFVYWMGLVACTLLTASSTRAQSFELDRFRSTPLASDGLAVHGTEAPGHLNLVAALTLEGSVKPLEMLLATQQRYEVISSQLALHANFALGLGERVALFGVVPVNLSFAGGDPPAGITTRLPRPESTSLGDVSLGGRLRILDDGASPLSLALQVVAFLPTSQVDKSQYYSGSEKAGVEPQLLAQLKFGAFKLRGNVGVRFRDTVELPSIQFGNALTWAGGIEYGFLQERLRLIADAWGASMLKDFGREVASPVELLFGGKYNHDSGLYAGVGAGPGINGGIGSPTLRALVTLGYASPVVRDKDGDGVFDDKDACPELAEDLDGFQDHDGCPDNDNDNDGVADSDDQCPRAAEDRDGFQDADGCPDPDNDRDGVPDGQDACPDQPEDTDDFEDADGCPDPDNDGDGVADVQDRCGAEPEDKDGFQDDDGCPDLDNDSDGVPDASDRCPNDAGPADKQGCPGARIEAGRISIEDRIEFGVNSDVIVPESTKQVDEVGALLAANPQVTKVRIEGHTDAQGPDAANLQLSKRRAASVLAALVKRGIAGDRLEAWGCGETQPISSNDDEAGRQDNRRVEFHVLTPPPESGPRNVEGCEKQSR